MNQPPAFHSGQGGPQDRQQSAQQLSQQLGPQFGAAYQQFQPVGVPTQHLQQSPTPTPHLPAPAWSTPAYAPPGPTRPGPGTGKVIALVTGAAVFTVAGLIMLILVVLSTGPAGFLVGLVLAMIPISLVVASFVWMDRWEPESRLTLVLAFVYGVVVAGLLSLLINTVTGLMIAAAAGEGLADFTTAAFVAPIVEETTKGLGLVAFVLYLRRKHYTGMTDCVVIGGLIASGFAFVEDILYFGRAFAAPELDDPSLSGAENALITFVLRGIFTPFAHPLFTVMTAIGLGLAVSTLRARWGGAAWLALPAGWFVAMSLHGLWNLSASVSGVLYLLVYAFIMVPVFIATVVAVIVLRQREGKLLAAILVAYRDAGWLSPADVQMMSKLSSRHQARSWANRHIGPGGAKVMARYQQTLTALAGLRISGTPAFTQSSFSQRESQLLHQVRNDQARLRLV